MGINDIPNIDFVNSISIDCEGGEKIFLLENKEFFKKIKKIMIELHGFIVKDNKNFNKECVEIIKSYNFKVKSKKNSCYYFEK
jgi:hypothetical protein